MYGSGVKSQIFKAKVSYKSLENHANWKLKIVMK